MSKKRRTKPTRFILAHLGAMAVGLLMIRALMWPILEAHQQQSFEDRLHAAVTDIASFIETRKSEVRLLADLPAVKSMDWPAIKPLLVSRLNQGNKDFEKFLLGLPSSHYYTTATGNPYQNDLSSFNDTDQHAELKSISKRDYWQVTVGRNDQHLKVDYVSNPMISYTTGIKQVLVTSSVHDQNKVVGLLAGSISWNQITQLIDQIQRQYPEQTVQYMLVSKDGNYWYHWNPDKVIQEVRNDDGEIIKNEINETSVKLHNILAETDRELNTLGRNMVAGKTGQTVMRFDEHRKAVFFSPIPNTNYSLAQVIKYSDYVAYQQQFSVFLFVAFIASMMVYLFFVYLIPKEPNS